MAFIDHRCACGHRMTQHRGAGRCQHYGGAGCGNPCSPLSDMPAPELMPSFTAQAKPVDMITPPGETFGNHFRTCGCEKCAALYEQLTA